MGEYAEMMLDGTCCECCGEFIGDATGYPGYCSKQCAANRGFGKSEKKGIWDEYVDTGTLAQRCLELIQKDLGGKFNRKTHDIMWSQFCGLIEGCRQPVDGIIHNLTIENNLAKNQKSPKERKGQS